MNSHEVKDSNAGDDKGIFFYEVVIVEVRLMSSILRGTVMPATCCRNSCKNLEILAAEKISKNCRIFRINVAK